MNGPVPVPLFVLLPAMVGFVDVDQQTPLAVTLAPPLDVTLPPETAVVNVIEEAAVVVTVGITIGFVSKTISLPYAVPAEFVA